MTAPRIVPIAEAQALFGRGTKDELAAAEWKPTDLDSVKTWAKRISGGK